MKSKKYRSIHPKRTTRRPVRRRATHKSKGMTSKDIVQSAEGKLGELGLGSPFSNETIQGLAQGVNPGDTKDEEKMRQLIYQVAKSFNLSVDEKTVNELTKTLRTTDMNQIGSMLGGLLR